MQRATFLFVLAGLVAFGFGACGSSDDGPEAAPTDETRELAEEATELVGDLEARADDLAAELDRIDADRRKLATKVERVQKNLRDAIGKLRSSLSDATSDAASAHGSAQEALNDIDAARKRLSVLENRFDYHLRNDH